MRQDAELQEKVKKEIYESFFRYRRREGVPNERELFMATRPQDLCNYDYKIGWGMLLNVTLNDARNAIISSESGRRQINNREMEDIRQEILTLEDFVPQDLDRIQFYRDRYEELISTQSIINMTNRQDN